MQTHLVSSRVVALDILRGLTIALMILVNTPGSWSHVYGPLLHAEWNGVTPTDMVFPLFLFIVGAAMFYSLSDARSTGQIPWRRLLQRSGMLFLIGLLLNLYPFQTDPSHWRLMGVLQRIAVCYLLAAILIIRLRPLYLVRLCGAILLCYWGVLEIGSHDPYGLQANLVRQLDLVLWGPNHLWQGKGIPFDPEGLLSTLPALVTLLIGYLTCCGLAKQASAFAQINWLLKVSLPLLAVSWGWRVLQPFNKSLWTGSYVLFTGAIAMLLLMAIIWLWEDRQIRVGLNALRIYGSNPLVGYVGSQVVALVLTFNITANLNGVVMNGYEFGYSIMAQYLHPKDASLLFAFGVVMLFYLVAWCMYQKRWFVKL